MAIEVALYHRTEYKFDRLVAISPHQVRLRPAPHCRTPISSYSLKAKPQKQYLHWQTDVFGNHVARFVFPEKARELAFQMDLVADLTPINPFDFFLESYATTYPFAYPTELARELAAFRDPGQPGPLLAKWIAAARRQLQRGGSVDTLDLIVALNRAVAADVAYTVRMEAGVYTPDETLAAAKGSCRDSGWLLVQILRHLGFAARFVSGYLVGLSSDPRQRKSAEGPSTDVFDLHAWAEVYLPGAGWIGLDTTSGLLAAEGHIPLTGSVIPERAAPVYGFTDPCEVKFDVVMRVTRLGNDRQAEAGAPWVEIAQDAQARYYVRPDSVQVDGDTVRLQKRAVYHSPRTDRFTSRPTAIREAVGTIELDVTRRIQRVARIDLIGATGELTWSSGRMSRRIWEDVGDTPHGRGMLEYAARAVAKSSMP